MIERLRVRNPAEAAGELSAPESTLCADSYWMSVLPMLRQWHVQYPVILPNVQMAGNT